MGEKKQPRKTERTVMVSARMPYERRQRAKRYALESGLSVQQIVNEALEEYLKKHSA